MSAFSIHDAIAAHSKAWHAVFVAQAGPALQHAMDASIDAFDVLLGTQAGTRQGARDLLAYLRWWLDEVGPFSEAQKHYPPGYFFAQARAADLAMLLFEPDPTAGLKAFAREMIQHAGNGDDVDGATIQGRAVAHGLLTEAAYDPAVHGPNDLGARPGNPWCVFAGPLARDCREGSAS